MDDNALIDRMMELSGKYPDMPPDQLASIALGQSAPPVAEQGGDFVGRLINNGVNAAKGVGTALTQNPLTTLSNVLAGAGNTLKDYGHTVMDGNVPIVNKVMHTATLPFDLLGMPMGRGYDEMKGGNYGTGLADMVSSVGLREAPGMLKKLPGVNAAGSLTSDAAKLGVQKFQDFMQARQLADEAASVPTKFHNLTGGPTAPRPAVPRISTLDAFPDDTFNPEALPPSVWANSDLPVRMVPVGARPTPSPSELPLMQPESPALVPTAAQEIALRLAKQKAKK
jgi:hypothetical protein